MSSNVLALKYRPRTFEAVVGQEHVLKALSHALSTGRLHHAYLLTGTRGVGKTTISRILAKGFNCTGVDGTGGVTAQPCNVCVHCTSIDNGRHVDYIELDAASNRGVAEMSQLLEQAVYAPSIARYKVFMVDEVHMLTNQAFNSMLKTLEEPPSHVKFILATTDPQKIPVTVLSRCLQFNLKQMAPELLHKHLLEVLVAEGVASNDSALGLIVRAAQGSVRDALSLTDQVIAAGAGEVSQEAAEITLGASATSDLIQIIDSVIEGNGPQLLGIADRMMMKSVSFNSALQGLGTLLNQVAIFKEVPAAIGDENPERAQIADLADRISQQEIQMFYQMVLHGRDEMRLAPDEYAGFTMTLLRMLAFKSD